MKWTYDKCKEEALKYSSKNEFKTKNTSAYRASIKNIWLNEICKHMLSTYEVKLKWTYDKCKEEALKYSSKNEFKKSRGSAYNSAYTNKWLDDICSHMIEVYRPKNYWTKENCKEEALKYNNRLDFKLKSNVAYVKSIKLKCLSDITSHMKIYTKQIDLTKENCQEEALKYTNKTEFYKKSSIFYKKSLKNNWLDEICTHMILKGNILKRCIYCYEFSDNNVYIGLTYNIENRHNRHINSKLSSVNKHINKTKLTPNLIKLTEYIPVNDASILEGVYIKEYKKNGWEILNKCKTGGIGGNIIKWTKEKCQEEALKYSSRSEFSRGNGSAYAASNRNKWLDIICSHMIV